MLYGIEIPPKGGDTGFANMYTAYDTLPGDLKARLADCHAEHQYYAGSVDKANPTASLTVFFSGMALAGIASLVVLVYGKVERTAATGELAQHHCPNCGAEVHHGGEVAGDWLCDSCGSEFPPKGVEQV